MNDNYTLFNVLYHYFYVLHGKLIPVAFLWLLPYISYVVDVSLSLWDKFFFYAEGEFIFLIFVLISIVIVWYLADLIQILRGRFKDKDNKLISDWYGQQGKAKTKRVLVIAAAIIACTVGISFLVPNKVRRYMGSLKYYSDGTGYSGWDVAYYERERNDLNWRDEAQEMREILESSKFRYIAPCDKLSNEESFLLWSALYEYDRRDYEVYQVLIAQGNELLALVVQITNDGENCYWRAAGYFK